MTKTIPLTRGCHAIVDDEDYDRLAIHKWYCHVTKDGRRSAARREHGTRRFVYMHREILGLERDRLVDHKDGNELNNTRSNLRSCTHSENNMNKRLARNSTSGARGVSWHKGIQKWQAKIKLNNHLKHLGYFASIEDAAKAYQEAENELFGEFSYPNSR